MGRKKLEGNSYIYECVSCKRTVKRNENNYNEKPCPKCGKEASFHKSDTNPEPVQVQAVQNHSGKTAASEWKNFLESNRPELGQLVLYLGSDGQIILQKWNENNIAHAGEYAAMGSLWAGVMKP